MDEENKVEGLMNLSDSIEYDVGPEVLKVLQEDLHVPSSLPYS